jgi:hypothetical protein
LCDVACHGEAQWEDHANGKAHAQAWLIAERAAAIYSRYLTTTFFDASFPRLYVDSEELVVESMGKMVESMIDKKALRSMREAMIHREDERHWRGFTEAVETGAFLGCASKHQREINESANDFARDMHHWANRGGWDACNDAVGTQQPGKGYMKDGAYIGSWGNSKLAKDREASLSHKFDGSDCEDHDCDGFDKYGENDGDDSFDGDDGSI